MTKISKKDKQLKLTVKEKVGFTKINSSLTKLGWDSTVEQDDQKGLLILAGKNLPGFGYMVREIKPFLLNKSEDFEQALKLQEKIKLDLVEVVPFKIYKGNRAFFETLNDFPNFLTIKKFLLFRKFFQSSYFSLEGVDKFEAGENKDDQLYLSEKIEAEDLQEIGGENSYENYQ